MNIKPYAASTLRRKYKETGLSKETLDRLHDYLFACMNFYRLASIETVWTAIHKVAPALVDRKTFDAVIAIDARNDELEYIIDSESAFFEDGEDDVLLLFDESLIYTYNKDYTPEDFEHMMKAVDEGIPYDGPMLMRFDLADFVALYRQQMNKPVYYPQNLLRYADEDYYEPTDQTRALKRFLCRKLDFDDESADDVISDLIFDIWDQIDNPMIPMQAVTDEIAVAYYEQHGLEPEFDEETLVLPFEFDYLQDLAKLYFEMYNHTRMPSNNGFTPNELSGKLGGLRIPESIHFGSGFRESLAKGDIDPDEFRDLVMNNSQMPVEGKEVLLKGLEEAQEQIKTDQKVGRNDPCPCGSGKKYKKCCGR